MNEIIKLPLYVKVTFVLLLLIGVCFIVYIGQDILVPIMLAFLFAVLLRPLVSFFNTKFYLPNVLAVILAVVLFVMIIIGIVSFISMQISDITNDFAKIERNISIHGKNIQQFIREHFNLSSREQDKYISDAKDDSIKSGKEVIGSTLMFFTDALLNLFLIPIYTFLILLYRNHFMLFLSKLINAEHHVLLEDILCQIKVAVRNYIVGLIFEMVVVSVLTSLGLMIIGVEYAILLGIITGILNLIPYIGILFAGLLSIAFSLTGTPDISIVFGVIVVNIIVQLIDNNILVPMIVNSKVQINAFVSIIGIIIGGALAGITGMFMAIPIIAILKVIFDRIEPLKPWGYFMGDDIPKTYEWHNIKIPLYSYNNATTNILFNTDDSPVFEEPKPENEEKNIE